MAGNLLQTSRPPLERMLKLHQKLKADEYPNCRKLAEALEVSAKTIQRDIEFMRSRLGLPIEYDAIRFGFYYTEPVTAFPSIEVSEGELVALLVAQKALGQYRGTPYEKPLKRAFQKIADGLQDRIAFQWDDLDATISFRGIGTTVTDIELFEEVSSAVVRSQEITFEYRKLSSSKYEPRRVQPYHLACIDQQWYLFAFDQDRSQLRTFVLPRMRNLRSLKLRFNRPADFSISQHLSDSLGVFTGTGRYRVRVEFDAFAARMVGEREWHPSQRIKAVEDGRIELSLELGSLEEIERWILSWGGHATVRAPAELVGRVRKAAEAILAMSPDSPFPA
jgi:predicted DNA-binding transcriptional regulator YafY